MTLASRTFRLSQLAGFGSANVGPGWFTSIMGTGILAICIAISPIGIPFGREIAIVLWSADTLCFGLFAILLAAAVLRDPMKLVRTLHDPAKAQLWGAPPMAAFTIAVGSLKIGQTFLTPSICIGAAQALFVVGAIGSLASAFLVPFLMFTRHEIARQDTFGSWLLPVVPPIVASVPAALLSATWPEAMRGSMLAFAYALLGIGVILAAIVIVIFYGRLVYDKVPAAPLVPTMWIVVGPLGQSVAGIIALGSVAGSVWPALGDGLQMAALAYGLLVWGFAMYWLTMAAAMTVRAMRQGLHFTLGWWSFTFPVGVLTAGTDALYGRTHADLFAFASVALLALLATMWTIVATNTLRSAARTSAVHFETIESPMSPAA